MTTPQPSAESMNRDLQTLYDSYLPEINRLINDCGWTSDDNVSQVFTMHVDELYAQSPYKILFVGRETFGWGDYNKASSAADLMKKYIAFTEPLNSPFWRFRRDLSQRFGISEVDFMKATLWTNLSKIDVRKHKPTSTDKRFDHLIQLFVKLLVDEIKIVKPDVVLIMTKDGFYNWHLNYYNWRENKVYFESKPTGQLSREPVSGVKIDRIGTPLLPVHTYQMCHPRALVSKGGDKANRFIEAIHRSVTESMHGSL